MSNEISSSGSNSSRDVQEAYDRRKQELKENHDRELKSIEQNYRKQEAEAAETGQAAVNHIRKATAETIKQAQSESEDRLQNEDEKNHHTYESLKRRNRAQASQLDQELHDKQETTQERIRELNRQETLASKKHDKQNSQLAHEEEARKHEIVAQVNNEIQQVEADGTKRLQETKQHNNLQEKKLFEDHKNKTERLQAEYGTTYEKLKKNGQSRAEQLEKQNQNRLETDRKQYSSQNEDLRNRYSEQTSKERDQGETKLRQVRSRQAEELHRTVDKGTKTNTKVREEYAKENQRLITNGEHQIDERNKMNKELLDEQKAEFKKEDIETKARGEAQLKQQQAAYDKQKRDEAKMQRQNLFQQRADFLEREEKLGEAHKSTIDHQDHLYNRALFKQQQKYARAFDKIESRKEDPFYQGLNFNAQLHETENAYVLKAKVPAHEIKNVDVRVKGDKVTISDNRKFEDRKEFDGQVSTTHSYQTQRQEFKLPIPVDEKAITKDRDAEGNIVVRIPKLGMPQV